MCLERRIAKLCWTLPNGPVSNRSSPGFPAVEHPMVKSRSAPSRFAALATGAVLLCAGEARAEALPVDLELVLAVDVSGSIDAEEMKLQRDGYIAALTDPEVVRTITRGVLGRIAVAYVEWAGYETRRLLIDWTLIDGPAAAQEFAAALAAQPIRGGVSTSISAAIEFVLPMFGANGFVGTRKVIDISGDGPNNQGALVTVMRDRANAEGVVINGLPILNDRPNALNFPSLPDLDRYYEGCVITGEGSFVVVANNFEAFGEAIRHKLIQEIAGVVPGARRFARSGLPARWRGAEPPLRPIRAGAVYEPGCDIGERQLNEFYRRRGWGN
jgi:hypothetical protein